MGSKPPSPWMQASASTVPPPSVTGAVMVPFVMSRGPLTPSGQAADGVASTVVWKTLPATVSIWNWAAAAGPIAAGTANDAALTPKPTATARTPRTTPRVGHRLCSLPRERKLRPDALPRPTGDTVNPARRVKHAAMPDRAGNRGIGAETSSSTGRGEREPWRHVCGVRPMENADLRFLRGCVVAAIAADRRRVAVATRAPRPGLSATSRGPAASSTRTDILFAHGTRAAWGDEVASTRQDAPSPFEPPRTRPRMRGARPGVVRRARRPERGDRPPG